MAGFGAPPLFARNKKKKKKRVNRKRTFAGKIHRSGRYAGGLEESKRPTSFGIVLGLKVARR